MSYLPYLINHGGHCKTAPVTPGLLNIPQWLNMVQHDPKWPKIVLKNVQNGSKWSQKKSKMYKNGLTLSEMFRIGPK